VKASFLVFLAFIVFLIIFSILSATLFSKFAPEYFGNPAISLYSTFRLFSVEGWYELPEAIAVNGGLKWGFFARCYFSILMFLGGIIGMSLINSIFVDAMAEDNNDEVLDKLKQIENQIKQLSNS
jgi:voltage-gated sodium channel